MLNVIFLLLSINDGSLIFTQDGSVIVKNRTNSNLTHVAIVFDGYVYEAKIPKVRKMTINQYFENNKNIIIMKPKTNYSPKDINNMMEFAESQLGKTYSIKAFTRGSSSKGLHCSEYVTKILMQSERYNSTNPGRVTPGSLWQSIQNDYLQIGGSSNSPKVAR